MKHIYLLLFLILFSGCIAAKAGTSLLKLTGKATWETAKFSGKMLYKGIRTTIYMAKGKEIVPLEKKSNSLYAQTLVNKKVHAKFLLDTGASCVQISRLLAAKLKIDTRKSKPVYVTLAGGHQVSAKSVILKEIKLGNTRIRNLPAIILDHDNTQYEDGLLGMSFLNHFNFQINPSRPELILEKKA